MRRRGERQRQHRRVEQPQPIQDRERPAERHPCCRAEREHEQQADEEHCSPPELVPQDRREHKLWEPGRVQDLIEWESGDEGGSPQIERQVIAHDVEVFPGEQQRHNLKRRASHEQHGGNPPQTSRRACTRSRWLRLLG